MKEQTKQYNLILLILGAGVITLGIIFISQGRIVSYSFIGAGVLLLIINLIKGLKKK